MSPPPHEVVYAPDGDISYVRMYFEANGLQRQTIYEKVCPPYLRQAAATYLVAHRDSEGENSTMASIPFSGLPPSVQKIFQARNRQDLEALLQREEVKGFVVKP